MKIARQDFLKLCTASAALRTIFEIVGQEEIEYTVVRGLDKGKKIKLPFSY